MAEVKSLKKFKKTISNLTSEIVGKCQKLSENVRKCQKLSEIFGNVSKKKSKLSEYARTVEK